MMVLISALVFIPISIFIGRFVYKKGNRRIRNEESYNGIPSMMIISGIASFLAVINMLLYVSAILGVSYPPEISNNFESFWLTPSYIALASVAYWIGINGLQFSKEKKNN